MKLFFRKYFITIILALVLIFVNLNTSIADTIYSVAYGFDYGWWDINTTNDASQVNDLLNDMGYTSTYNKNWSADKAYQYLAVDEVFYFTGHGNKGVLTFYDTKNKDTFIEALGNQRNLTGLKNLNNLSSNKLKNVKLMFFNSCYSALSMEELYWNSEDYNLLDVACKKGAKCALGFEDLIETEQSKCWANSFFTFLSFGMTINESIDEADYTIEYLFGTRDGGTKSHAFRGDADSKINLD